MKFTASKETLESALFAARRAINLNSPLGILKGIHMTVRGDQLTVVGTDAELTIRHTAEVEVVSEGDVIVNVGICDLVKRLPAGSTVEVERVEDGILVRYSGNEARIGVYGGEFPAVPSVSGSGIEVDAAKFLNAVSQVHFACYLGFDKPVLTGVLFKAMPFGLELAATDAVRVNWAYLPADGGDEIEAIIPKNMLEETLKVLSGDKVTICIRDNFVVFRSGPVDIFSRTIAGKFPDYKMVTPPNYYTRVRVKTKVLMDALNRAVLILDEQNVSSTELKVGGGKITVSAFGVNGSIVETMEADDCEGEPASIRFNTRYLMESVKAVNEKDVTIYFAEHLSRTMAKIVDTEENYYSIIVAMVKKAAEAA